MSAVALISDEVRSKFNFSVDKFPLSGPDGLRTPWYALFRSDTQKPVGKGSVSNVYVPHTTEDIVALCDAVSVAFDGIGNVDCHFRDGHYVVITPSDQQRLSIFGGNDNIWPRVVIGAGYDGKAFRASIASYRDMCRNLHITRQCGTETTIKINHNRNLRNHMDELISQFNNIKSGWNNLVDVVRNMERNRVSMIDFLDQIYGRPDENSKHAVSQHKNRTEAIFKRLQREVDMRGETMSSDFVVSGWLAFNAVQGFIQHDKRRQGRNKNDHSASLILSLTDKDIEKAEELALAC